MDCVDSYRYLGTIIESQLTFEKNCENVCKKGHQRLFCVRKLSRFHIDKTMMILFYNKNDLNQIVKWASKIIGESQPSLAGLYSNQLQRKASTISRHCSHPLHAEFQLLRSGSRFVAPRCRTRRYRNHFVPLAIELLNKNSKR